MARKKKQKEIFIDDIKDDRVCKYESMFRRAKSIHDQRIQNHDFYARVAHMENLYDGEDVQISEGSSQAILRKMRAQTLQRVPDGEIIDQYDKNSIEHAEIEFLFKNKILRSEFDCKDMLKNLWRTFNNAWIYGNCCVRTGFEKDLHGDFRISYKIIPYNQVFPNPDCDFIEEAEWYIIEEMISRAELEGQFDENDNLKDSTYNEDTLRYILQTKHRDGQETMNKNRLQDDKKGITKIESVKVRTLYKRGCKEFVSYVPSLNAVLRTVKNYDPRKDLPLHFMILEPDPEFPLGASTVMYTLAHQQFADTFLSTAFNTLLLSMDPPLMGFGDLTETDVYLEPGAWWPMGTNPNNKIEKFTTETTTLTQYGPITEQISGSMARNVNSPDQTIASDAHVPGWSATPQGVEAQQQDKTITVNQYQKRVEVFFSEWANHALRSYISAMTGSQELTVDEETRRKIWSIEDSDKDPNNPDEIKSIVVDNKITIDFDRLSSDMLEFQVRTGSLIQSRQEEQRRNIQELIVPISQTLGALSDENKPAFEANLMQMMERLCELADIDFAQSAGQRIDDRLVIEALKAAYLQIADQNKAIEQLQQVAVAGLNGGQSQQQPQQQMMPQQQQPMAPQDVQAAQQQQGSSQLPPEVMQQLLQQQQAQQNAPAAEPAPEEEMPPEQVE